MRACTVTSSCAYPAHACDQQPVSHLQRCCNKAVRQLGHPTVAEHGAHRLAAAAALTLGSCPGSSQEVQPKGAAAHKAGPSRWSSRSSFPWVAALQCLLLVAVVAGFMALQQQKARFVICTRGYSLFYGAQVRPLKRFIGKLAGHSSSIARSRVCWTSLWPF